jgi:preprotein translocase subunit SecE
VLWVRVPPLLPSFKDGSFKNAITKKDKTMAKGLQFFREVRQEGMKVTWLTRKETVTTTVIVFIMIFIMSMFLLFADWVISTSVKFILGN